jgi:hypothetical protein
MSGTINHGPGLDHAIGAPCPANDPACAAEQEATKWMPAVSATYSTRDGAPQSFDLFGAFATEAERDEWLARFPKSAKVRPGTLSTHAGQYGQPGFVRLVLPTISATVKLTGDGVNRGVNETGLRRVRAILKVAGLRWRGSDSNAYGTRAEFEEAI